MYGKSVEEFFEMSKEHIISPEEAGAGFAAAVALAEQFRGQEISSKQALISAGISVGEAAQSTPGRKLTGEESARALSLCRSVRATLAEQSEGWAKRPLFERQWMVRDFRKNAGMPAERWLETLGSLEQALEAREGYSPLSPPPPLEQLAAFYARLQKLAAGYEKDPKKLEEQSRVIKAWQEDVGNLIVLLGR
jgi:hypothetical protein